MKILKSPGKAAIAISIAVLTASGCKTVVRENIISNVETGIGVTLAENPKTEMYEAKVGFIRSQFYSIPTGKKVEGTNQANSANITPEVISGIRIHSGAENLFIGMDVSESFAVGKLAVASEAATAMYIANADKSEKARASADAIKSKNNADHIAAYIGSESHQTTAKKLNELRNKKMTSTKTVGTTTFNQDTSAAKYADALASEKGDTIFNILNNPSKSNELQEIIGKLEEATK